MIKNVDQTSSLHADILNSQKFENQIDSSNITSTMSLVERFDMVSGSALG
jgi:hypothetical protein